MSKDFSSKIDEIMTLVENGSDLPFAITREDGGWNINYFSLNTTASPEEIKAQAAEFLAFMREKDPYTVAHTGVDFAKGSFPYVYDKVFCARLRAEYEANSSGKVNSNEFNALLNAVENNIGSFSQQTIDYLLEFDQPLRALYQLNPIPLYNSDITDGEPYDADRIDAFVEAVESKIAELIGRPNVEPMSRSEANNTEHFSDAKVNEYDTTHIITSLLLNGVEIELGEDTENPLPFYVESNRSGENLFSFRTDNYIEALTTYSGQINDRVYELSIDRDKNAVMQGVEYVKLTADECLPSSRYADFTGKLIIVDPNELLPEYRSSTSQLLQCTHGNGARPNAKGTSVFCTELLTGASVVYGRHQILGIADENKLPQWAKAKLEIQRDPAVFEFGGYHFKPYRQFHKGEIDRPLKGDSRPWKTDGQYMMRNMSSDRSLGISAYDWGKTDYTHEKFYAVANSEADIFKCLENGKLYVPFANELFHYNEPTQKEQAKTQTAQYRECASSIDKDVSAVRYDEMPGGSARYDLKIALDRLNYQHGTENVNAVLAAVVIFNDNDGRYSRENRQWAASVPNPPVDVVRRCVINTHPTILNGLIDKARASTAKTRETRPDFLGKINDNKQKVEQDKNAADAPSTKKKRDGQEV